MESTFTDAALAGLSDGHAVLLSRGGGTVWTAREGQPPHPLPGTDARLLHAAHGRLTLSEPGGVFTSTVSGEERHQSSRVPADRVHAVRVLPHGTFMALKLMEPKLIWGWWERITARMRLLSESPAEPLPPVLVASHGASVAWVEGSHVSLWREDAPEVMRTELPAEVSAISLNGENLYLVTARGVLVQRGPQGRFESFLSQWTPSLHASDSGVVWLTEDRSRVMRTGQDGATVELYRAASPGALEGIAAEGQLVVATEREERALHLRWLQR